MHHDPLVPFVNKVVVNHDPPGIVVITCAGAVRPLVSTACDANPRTRFLTLYRPLVGIVVLTNDLTGIVVGVTLPLSARISPRSEAESNARMRTGDTIVAF